MKESRRDEVFGTHLMACTQHDLLLGSSTHLYERSGRFWESESDAEYEDRGTVKDRSRGESRVVWRAAAVSTVAERPQPLSVSTFRAATSNIGASSPSTRPTRAPWTKLWKGPLPPRRVSPARTFGDFILPAMDAAPSKQGGDPISVGVRITKSPHRAEGPRSVGPNRAHSKRSMAPSSTRTVESQEAANVISRPSRRLVNPHIFLTAETTPQLS